VGKHERPQPEGTGGAVDGSRHDHSTASPSSPGIAIREKLLWGWDDLERLTGLSRRLLQREVSARRMPGPDVKVCRRALWRPATITGWLNSLAQQQAHGQGARG
jgi:hypothetical protein